MAARSPAKKAGKATPAPAKKATKASAPAKRAPAGAPKRPAAGPSVASPSRHTAKATSKSPVKGASKAVSSTSAKSAPTKAREPAAKSPAKAPATQQVKPSPRQPARPAAKETAKQPAKSAPAAPAPAVDGIPKPKFNKEGLGYTKDFDLSFVKVQYELLQRERAHLTGQAHRLEAEAHQLVEEAEMGVVQFDDEGGEGDTMVVERERDLALSAQARDAVAEIDAALARINAGTYGYSIMSGRPIPKERLEASPWSSVLVEEKVGG